MRSTGILPNLVVFIVAFLFLQPMPQAICQAPEGWGDALIEYQPDQFPSPLAKLIGKSPAAKSNHLYVINSDLESKFAPLGQFFERYYDQAVLKIISAQESLRAAPIDQFMSDKEKISSANKLLRKRNDVTKEKCQELAELFPPCYVILKGEKLNGVTKYDANKEEYKKFRLDLMPQKQTKNIRFEIPGKYLGLGLYAYNPIGITWSGVPMAKTEARVFHEKAQTHFKGGDPQLQTAIVFYFPGVRYPRYRMVSKLNTNEWGAAVGYTEFGLNYLPYHYNRGLLHPELWITLQAIYVFDDEKVWCKIDPYRPPDPYWGVTYTPAKKHALRTWTSGKFTIDAICIEQKQGFVLLEKKDGSRTSIKKSLLSAADQRYLDRFDKRK